MFGKWLGGALGWTFGGPIGGIFGFALGAIFDNRDNIEVQTHSSGGRRRTTQGDFTVSLLVLTAAVMKADGKILKSELEFVKGFLRKNFGEEKATQNLLILKEILNKDIPLSDVCSQIKSFMNYSYRLQLLNLLFGLAAADGEMNEAEVKVIAEISYLLDINSADYESIKAMFGQVKGFGIKKEDNYKILEIETTATDDEVKKAYRKMAMKHHPDKVANLGPEIQKDAQEKFRKILEAYEAIKAERGMV